MANAELDAIDRSTEEGQKEWFRVFINQNMAHNYVEAKVLRKLYKAFKAAGNPIVKVDDTEEVTDVSTLREVQEIVFNLDECFLITEKGGWIRFILGNDWDVICDYTLSLEETMEPIDAWITKHQD